MNYDLFRDIHGLAGNAAVDAAMRFSAKYLLFVVGAALAALVLQAARRQAWRHVVTTGGALLLAYLLGLAAAAAHPERRPFELHRVHVLVSHAPGQSFPSDHATAAFAAAFATTAFLSRRWGIVLTVCALLIGFARVYDGIHYPADVGGSALVAAAGVGLAAAAAVATHHQHARSAGAGEDAR
jgi:undecaprenyl-diphosphatase